MVANSQLQPASFAEFLEEAKHGNLVAVTRTVAADSASADSRGSNDCVGPLDPLEAFERVAGSARHAFLFESVEGGEGVAKYSFLGADPYMIVRGRDAETIVERDGKTETRAECAMDFLRRHFRENKLANRSLGPLAGGAVGYLGYRAAAWFEPALKRMSTRQSKEDDAFLMFYRTLVVFDRAQRQTRVVSVVFTDEAGANSTDEAGGNSTDEAAANEVRLRELYDAAVRETERIAALLQAPTSSANTGARSVRASTTVRSNWSKDDFQQAVRDVKEHILAGDCYQAVLSQRFAREVKVGPVPIYRALRQSNPAPYTYLLKVGDDAIIGASPEMLVRCRGRELDYRPIAGTRPRGATEAEDKMLAAEMCADEKEVAEHMMLVDLGRNDLGRVAEFGSVKVDDLMSVERYSKVQHLVSSLSACLNESSDRFDALAACFPAGTVTGAPKVRAMEIIRELEPDERGVYAGAVLYMDYAENLDSCIAIRTIVLRGGEASVQAGAGIVADSVPEREYEETVHKAGALLRAIELAEGND